ncbi:MAG: hypothetical protein DRK00_07385 [Thermoprotei archaeon]|nr:MAG: hypothetical protein DRK00_07385 [Thermoprotei archaeon]
MVDYLRAVDNFALQFLRMTELDFQVMWRLLEYEGQVAKLYDLLAPSRVDEEVLELVMGWGA